ncbi:MAG: Bro-N domain-containing protein [Clostridia bacterium]|nr:Bro-N domain-containing protein [Clostridia bacterium]
MQENKLALFEDKEIRKTWYNEDWYFSVEDVVYALTESVNTKDYIKKMKKRNPTLAEGWGQFVTLLQLNTNGGRQKISCSNTKGILRIIQSIPSPKAEPFKLWLAQVGSERLEEIVNPELAINRAKETYIRKGYEDTWISQRLKSIDSRKELTYTWKQRGAKGRDYAILTDEIYKSTFDLNTTQYKELKGINKTKRNLRDSMGKLELAITNLAEVTANEMHNINNSYGIDRLKEDVQEAGKITGKARVEIEQKIGKKVAEKTNYKNLTNSNIKQIEN